MGLFSGLTKSNGGEYQNVGSAKTTTTTLFGGEEPPLVTATPVASSSLTAATASSSPPLIPLTSCRFPTTIDTCPHCHSSQITTKIRTYPSCETWTIIILLFLVFWPVCWFPLVIDSCKTTDHYCTNCNESVGRVKPLSDCCAKEMG
mmetsp:Transcript_7460/g.12305  ORF Transcript_7460/g.12305 Transcript_7460/m.12305 type:complete len:147 (+) Transcript_7460:259-699(+)